MTLLYKYNCGIIMNFMWPLLGMQVGAQKQAIKLEWLNQVCFRCDHYSLAPSSPLLLAQAFGLEVIPEEVPVILSIDGTGVQLNSRQRQVDAAVQSWQVGKAFSTSWTSGLNLSARASDIDLKEFLQQRGRYISTLLDKLVPELVYVDICNVVIICE